ncbi:hypothetical protein Ahia01_000281500, partial [Argonauta hians]
LLEHYDWLLGQLLAKSDVDVIYLDFAKAFDKVDHGVICHKLRDLGVTGKLGEWIHDFLTNRTQTVKACGATSDEITIASGVPQGTVLGPLLFIISLVDMPSSIQGAKVISYADDTKIAKAFNSQEDSLHLQKQLDKIYKWAETNNMLFNANKFQTLQYRHSQKNPSLSRSTYSGPNGTEIPQTKTVRDLGILMCNDTSFHDHIARLTTQSRRLVAWVLRTIKTRQQEPMMTLWKSFILSRLDYCSQLWSPYNVKEITELEAAQRNFTRRIDSMQHATYWDRLKMLKLYSLERRRERYAIICVWKILEGLVPNFGISFYTNNRTGRHCQIPKLPTSSSRQRSRYCNSLGFKGPQLFNMLPRELRDMKGVDVATFKSKLDLLLWSVPDEPTSHGESRTRAAASNSLLHQMPLLKNITKQTLGCTVKN